MNYSFASAIGLYREGLHPRLYFSRDDRGALLRKLAKGDGAVLLRAFRQRVSALVREVNGYADDESLAARIGKFSDPGFLRLVQSQTSHGLFEMAMLAFLDDDQAARDAVLRLLRLLPVLHDRTLGGQTRHRLGYYAAISIAPAYDLAYEFLTPEQRRELDCWLLRIIRELLAELGPFFPVQAGSNIPLNKLLNAIMLMLVVENNSGVPALDKEWELVLMYAEAGVHGCLSLDGYPAEDMGYGTIMAGRLGMVMELLRRAGKYDVYKNCPRYGKFGRAILHMVQPWGEYLSTTGDHGDDFGMREFILPRLAAETGDPTLLWLLGTLSYPSRLAAGEKPAEVRLRPGFQVPHKAYPLLFADQFSQARHPAKAKIPTAFCDRGRGLVSLRSGWTAKDTFVLFDASQRPPNASGHEHASGGHFSLSALGEYFSIDTGRYNMEQDCHSVVLVNGRSGRDTKGQWRFMEHAGRLTAFEPGGFVDLAAADTSLQHNAYWARRHLALVKGHGVPAYVWVIDDINVCNGEFDYWWQMQVCPENQIQIRQEHATVAGWRKGNLLDVHFAQPLGPGAKFHRLLEITQDVGQPSSREYVGDPLAAYRQLKMSRPAEQVHYSAFQRPRLLAKFRGFGFLMSIMLPREKDTVAARVTALEAPPGSIAARITFGDLEDTVIFAKGTGLLRAGDIDGCGDWCVIRRRLRDGRPIKVAAGNCTRLRLDGKPLRF